MTEKLERIQRIFLWIGLEEKTKINLVNWEKVCKPKSMGGLGIRKISDLKKALLTKIGWILMKEKMDWSMIMRVNYFNHTPFPSLLSSNEFRPRFKIWNSFVKNRKLLKQGLKWQVGSGEKIRFWEDNWIGDRPLASSRFSCLMIPLKDSIGSLVINYISPSHC